jgi:uncharacterized coiled-coil DUF342 family protein
LIDQQKTNEIAKITRQLDALREQINTENAETRTHVEKRDKLNEQFKKLRIEIRELRKERDDLNENVKVLKQQRDESHIKIRAIIEKIKTESQEITELKKKTQLKRRHKLQKEFDDIEWKIQTTSLDIQEEKIGESKKIKDEADSLHGTYIQVKEKIKPLHEEVKRLIEHRKKLQDAVREEEAKQKKSVERALKEKLESEARNKLKRGEKLSWDEFKMLAGNESEDV